MSKKYIIKNCECKVKGKTTLCVKDIPYKKCENITDCKLKQIVEYCRNIEKDHYWGMREIRFSQEILKLLDIQECE
jgi:hypothetical protein